MPKVYGFILIVRNEKRTFCIDATFIIILFKFRTFISSIFFSCVKIFREPSVNLDCKASFCAISFFIWKHLFTYKKRCAVWEMCKKLLENSSPNDFFSIIWLGLCKVYRFENCRKCTHVLFISLLLWERWILRRIWLNVCVWECEWGKKDEYERVTLNQTIQDVRTHTYTW